MKFNHKSYILDLKSRRGYTLIELLAVTAILVALSVVVSNIIVTTLRGSTKTKVTTNVAQNGEYAQSVISSIISDSRNIVAVDGSDIDDCASPTPPSSTSSIRFKRIDGGTTEISCEQINGTDTIASNGAALVNTSSVIVSACSFSCSQVVFDPYSIPIVNISFTIADKNTGSNEFKSTATYNASSSLRVYSP